MIPHVGDRDARSEDRQLLLDAVLAATDHLVITFSGRDERTNRERPPAVPIAELLDVVDRTVRVDDDAAPRRARRCWCNTRCSPSIRATSRPDAGATGPRSFDPVSLDGAVALSGAPASPPSVPPGASRRWAERSCSSTRWSASSSTRSRPFCASGWAGSPATPPTRSTTRCRSTWIPSSGGRWGTGCSPPAWPGRILPRPSAAELARGILPPGRLVDAVLGDVTPTVEALVAAAGSLPVRRSRGPFSRCPCTAPDGRLLIGTVPGVRERDHRSLRVLPVGSRSIGWRPGCAFWRLSAAWPDQPIASVLLGRGRKRPGGRQLIRTSVLPPLTAGAPKRLDPAGRPLAGLGVLVDLYDRGMREPLPIYCDTSAAWANAGGRATIPARRPWAPGSLPYEFPREDSEPEHLMVLGGVLPFESPADRCAPAGRAGPRMGRIRKLPLRLPGPPALGAAARPRANAGQMRD